MSNILDVQRMTFADSMRKLRISKQLTQRDLARLAMVCWEDIDKIEHGIPLPLETKLKILKVLYAKKVFLKTTGRRIHLAAQTVPA
jgi:DNA-binding XRE family transcriptional regulator